MAATITALRTDPGVARSARASKRSLLWTLSLPLLTAVMLAVDGFHPLAEDGGLYVAGVEYQLDPTLFPHYTAFVTEHLRFSLFAPLMAVVVRIGHVPLAWTLLLVYVFSLWLVLYSGLQVLRRCTTSLAGQFVGVVLLAMWSTMPIAGTSLLLVDPYLTARSLSTPLSLIAVAFALDAWGFETAEGRRSFAMCVFGLACAALLHPLMAAYALALVVLLRLLRSRRAWPLCAALAIVTVLVAAALSRLATADPPAEVAASLSRYYWFLSQWHWYELCGLVGPFAVLVLLLKGGARPSATAQRLTKATIAGGTVAVLIAVCFAHKESASYFIARLQPLRIFLLVYAVMTLLLGAWSGQWCAQFAEKPGRRMPALVFPTALLALSGFALFNAQRATFPSSQHVEWPWAQPLNPWSRAFVWVRDNTPRDALFALDADYITTDGEDAQAFRATSLRSAVPDFSKDGGEASITPSLAPVWKNAVAEQFAVQAGTQLLEHASLSRQHDSQRDMHLRALGVTWVVLHANAPTTHQCPYINGTVKVCRLN